MKILNLALVIGCSSALKWDSLKVPASARGTYNL